ncbi:MAG: hypothetical protein Q8K58_14535 [Acidimicrobiales bacterium]|nr:hypothetical protein [Acidimicrobiales bacterium]
MGMLLGLALLVMMLFLLVVIISFGIAEPITLLLFVPAAVFLGWPIWRYFRASYLPPADPRIRLSPNAAQQQPLGDDLLVVSGFLFRPRLRRILDAIQAEDLRTLARLADKRSTGTLSHLSADGQPKLTTEIVHGTRGHTGPRHARRWRTGVVGGSGRTLGGALALDYAPVCLVGGVADVFVAS